MLGIDLETYVVNNREYDDILGTIWAGQWHTGKMADECGESGGKSGGSRMSVAISLKSLMLKIGKLKPADDVVENVSSRPLRIFHGPRNVVGMAGSLAREQRKSGHLAHAILFNETSSIDPDNHDISLGFSNIRIRRQLPIRLGLFIFCLFNYDIFNFYFAKTLLPFGFDLPLLRLFGKKIVMVYCGSDIRLIEVEKERNPYWNKIDCDVNTPELDAFKKRRMKWQSIWVHKAFAPRSIAAFALEVYGKDKVITDIFVQNSMDLGRCEASFLKIQKNVKPLLVHAPSKPTLKGTSYLEAVLDRLRENGYDFNYQRIEGLPNDEAQRIYQEEADIILDQFLLGGVGMLSMEGMYAGKPVVAYMLESVKEEYCPDIPIVSASIDDLYERLAELLDHPETWEEIGRAGQKYVGKHCNRATISEQLIDLYRKL